MKIRALLSGSLAALSVSGVHATSWYWDADADTSATTGGTGNWILAGALWRNGSATGTLTAYNDAAGPNADTAANLVLAGGADTGVLTLTASTSYNLNKITASNSYTLSTNTANATFVGTAPAVDVASGKTLTWGIDLSAAGSTVTKSGSGIWKFNNTGGQITSNSTTMDVTTGTLQFDTAAATANLFTGTGGIVKVGSGATLSLIQTNNGGYTSAKNWTLGSKVILNGGTFNGGSSNGAQFQRLLNTTAVQVDAASTIALSSGNFSQNLTLEGAFTGSGALSFNRANANTKYFNLKGDMSGYSGNVTIGTSTAAGYVLFGHSSGWGTGNLTLTGSGSRVMIGDEVATTYNAAWTGGSALAYTTGTFSPTGTITVGSGAELSLMNSTASYGILFSPSNGITVNGGTLSIKGTTGTSAYVPAAGTTWAFGGTALSTVSGNIQLNNSGAVFQVADAVSGTSVDATVTGAISGINGFKKTGTGTLSLAAANSSWSGAILIDNGTVQLGTDTAAGSGLITIGDTDVSANSHSLRLAGAVIGNDVVSKFMYTADYLGSITAQGGVASTINGDVTIMPAVSGAPSRGGHLASTGAGSVLRLMGQLNVGGAQNVITQRDGTVEYGGGGSTAYTLQVTGTSRIAANDGISTLSNVQLGVSGAATLDLNGFNQSLVAVSKGANAATITNGGATDSTLTLTSSTAREYAGVIQDGVKKVGLIKEGNSSLVLSGTNTYTGDTTVSAGTLLVSGSLGNSAVTVGSSGALGGDGTIGGTLYFEPGADFVFDPLTTLTVNGGSVSFGGFSIADLVGFSAAVADGTYTLINGSTTFDFANVANFGEANAYDLGGGRKAYFSSGSLNLVVVPEPAAALIGGMGLLLLLRRRRA